MTFKEFLEETRRQFREDLPAFMQKKGLASPKIVPTSFDLEKNPPSLAVYPTSSNGSTFRTEGKSDMVRLSVDLFCNRSATEKGVTQAEAYFSAMVSFLQQSRFGEASELVESLLIRMDEGEPVNGGMFLIEARINTHTDYGWD